MAIPVVKISQIQTALRTLAQINSSDLPLVTAALVGIEQFDLAKLGIVIPHIQQAVNKEEFRRIK